MTIFLKFAKRNGKFMKENAALVANMKMSALKNLKTAYHSSSNG